MSLLVVWVGVVGLMSLGGCGQDPGHVPDTDAHLIPNDGSVSPPFTVTQLLPNHGPVRGGIEVTVRGFGFMEDSRVYFGQLLVDAEQTFFFGANRILVIAPPGAVGPVDIKVLRPDGEGTVFQDGFTYDQLSVDPASGSSAGGTFVRVNGSGTHFTPDDVVTIGEEPLLEQTWVSSSQITGRTAPSPPGLVTVSVQGASGLLSVPEAFEFYDSADPINGGLGGGPIAGEVNITVLDTYTSEPVVDAYVLMGADASSPYQALTDSSGRVTFSAPGLEGPQMLSVAAEEYERVSIIAFDARDVTIFLTPFVPPNPGTIPGTSWSAVEGYVSFGGVEFGQGCDFNQMVPEPAAGERRIIKVYQTVSDYDYYSSEPSTGGIVLEGDDCITGYDYYIYARPGSYAVYALAGIENTTTHVFTPYAMGIARGVLSGPDQVVQANITIEFPLGEKVTFEFPDAPELNPPDGPIGYKIRVFVDLGGDGYITRPDTQRSVSDATDTVVIDKLPELSRNLVDGHYTASLEAHTGGQYPYSKVIIPALPAGSAPVQVDDWLGIPQAVDPVPGGVPTTNRLIWSADGFEPTFNIVIVQTFPGGDPYWRVYLHGSVNQFVLPDLFGLGGGLDGHPSGEMYWHVIAVEVEGMDFNDFSYRYLNDKYWSGTAANGFQFTFPDVQ